MFLKSNHDYLYHQIGYLHNGEIQTYSNVNTFISLRIFLFNFIPREGGNFVLSNTFHNFNIKDANLANCPMVCSDFFFFWGKDTHGSATLRFTLKWNSDCDFIGWRMKNFNSYVYQLLIQRRESIIECARKGKRKGVSILTIL